MFDLAKCTKKKCIGIILIMRDISNQLVVVARIGVLGSTTKIIEQNQDFRERFEKSLSIFK